MQTNKKGPEIIDLRAFCFDTIGIRRRIPVDKLLAGAAANRRVVEANVAAAAVLAARREAFAAGLQHFAALLVAAGAGDAAAIGSVLTLAMAVGHRALAHLHAVHHAAAAAKPVAQHAAKVLQCGARHFVFAAAVHLEAAGAFLEFDLAPRHHAPIAGHRRGSGHSRRVHAGHRA